MRVLPKDIRGIQSHRATQYGMSLTSSPITAGGALRFLLCLPSTSAAFESGTGWCVMGSVWLAEIAALSFGPRSSL